MSTIKDVIVTSLWNGVPLTARDPHIKLLAAAIAGAAAIPLSNIFFHCLASKGAGASKSEGTVKIEKPAVWPNNCKYPLSGQSPKPSHRRSLTRTCKKAGGCDAHALSHSNRQRNGLVVEGADAVAHFVLVSFAFRCEAL